MTKPGRKGQIHSGNMPGIVSKTIHMSKEKKEHGNLCIKIRNKILKSHIHYFYMLAIKRLLRQLAKCPRFKSRRSLPEFINHYKRFFEFVIIILSDKTIIRI